MRLQRISSWIFALVLLVLGANALLLVLITRANDDVASAQDQRRKALALSSELQRETELLGGLVRAYTATGESRYLLYYYDILAARQGEKALPSGAQTATYWDDVIAGRRRHEPQVDGRRQSLVERMKSLDDSGQDLAALQRVLDATAAMHEVEQRAFAATQGLFDPDTGDYVSDGVVRLDYATQLVHSSAYNALKANLSTAVQGLFQTIDTRTGARVAAADRSLSRYLGLSLVAMAATILLAVLAVWGIRRNALVPIARLGRATDRLAEGDYSTRVSALAGFEELGALGRTVNSMAQAIEDDLSHRHSVQRQLEAARTQAEEATRAKSRFLAHMSHEIRTPMNAILGMSYLAQRSGLNRRQHDYVEKIHGAARSLLAVINDLLDLSKVEAGRLELAQQRFCVEDVARDALWLVRQQAQDKGLALIYHIDDAMLVGDSGSFIGDPLRLGQVLTNLLANAVRFTREGQVRLSISRAVLDDGRIRLRFEVRDSGIGLNPEQARRLFEDFSQAEPETAQSHGGTGLGLAIARRFVERMGGRIDVESRPGEGARFHFALVLDPADPLDAAPAVLARRPRHRMLLWISDPATRTTLADLLQLLARGAPAAEVVQVDSLAAARAAIAAAQAAGEPFDRLFVDGDEGAGGRDTAGASDLAAAIGSPPPRLVLLSHRDGPLHPEPSAGTPPERWLVTPVMPRAVDACLADADPTVDLPATAVVAVDASNRLAGRRVLLVEDNPVNRQVASELLASAGMDVTQASNGLEALRRVQDQGPRHFDVVLLDLRMPVMDGYAFCQRVREEPAGQSLPIVALSAHALADERARCLALGMQSHLAKPIEPERLFQCLQEILCRRDDPSGERQPDPPAVESGPETDPVQSGSELGALIALLRSGDSEGRARWQARRGGPPQPLTEADCRKVDAALAAFDFDLAAKLLEQVLERQRGR